MLQSDILNIVYARIAANMPSGVSSSRLFTASKAPVETNVSTSKIILTLVPATGAITTLGSDEVCRRREYGGVVFAACHTPLQPGNDIQSVRYAEHIQALFEGRNADAPLYYDNVAARGDGRQSTASFITNVVITYRLETVR